MTDLPTIGTNLIQIKQFKSHVLGKYGYKNVCSDCKKSYKTKSHLTRHQRFECGKEPQFPCPLCHYRGKHKHALTNHYANKHSVRL